MPEESREAAVRPAAGAPAGLPVALHTHVLRQLSEAVYVVDRQRRIQYWNDAAEVLTGVDASVAVGRFCGDGLLNHVDDTGTPMCGPTRCPLALTMEDGQPRSCRVQLHHSDGHLVPVGIRATALRDAEGEVQGAVEVFWDDSQHRDARLRIEQLDQTATHDALTGLGNRRHLDRRLEQRLERWRRDPSARFGVLLLDLDRFKAVNDTLGHLAGDEVLRAVAVSLRLAAPDGSDLARFGGEEFVAVVPCADVAGLEAVAEQMRAMVASIRMERFGRAEPVTASCGGTVVRPEDVPLSLLARADSMLLKAKWDGRDRVAVEP